MVKTLPECCLVLDHGWSLLSGQETTRVQESQVKISKRPREPVGEEEELPEPGSKHTRQNTEPAPPVSKDKFSYMGMPFLGSKFLVQL